MPAIKAMLVACSQLGAVVRNKLCWWQAAPDGVKLATGVNKLSLGGSGPPSRGEPHQDGATQQGLHLDVPQPLHRLLLVSRWSTLRAAGRG